MRALFLSLALSTLAAWPCAATDFTQPIINFDGKPLCLDLDKSSPCKEPLTLGVAAATALSTPFRDEIDPTGHSTVTDADKLKRGQLAMQVYGAKDVRLSSKDKVIIEGVIAKGYNAFVYARAYKMLEEDGSSYQATDSSNGPKKP